MVTSGGATVILNNANTYSGGTIVAGGNLQVGSSTVLSGSTIVSGAVGTGTLNLAAGTINSNVAVSLANPVVFPNSTVTINSNIAQGNNLTFAGATTLVGSNTLNLSNNTANGPGLTTFSGGIGGGALNLVGNGVLQLPTANSFSGGLTLTGEASNARSISPRLRGRPDRDRGQQQLAPWARGPLTFGAAGTLVGHHRRFAPQYPVAQ